MGYEREGKMKTIEHACARSQNKEEEKEVLTIKSAHTHCPLIFLLSFFTHCYLILLSLVRHPSLF
jgi:hypothetical protein